MTETLITVRLPESQWRTLANMLARDPKVSNVREVVNDCIHNGCEISRPYDKWAAFTQLGMKMAKHSPEYSALGAITAQLARHLSDETD